MKSIANIAKIANISKIEKCPGTVHRFSGVGRLRSQKLAALLVWHVGKEGLKLGIG
jgi:hypothetical protein